METIVALIPAIVLVLAGAGFGWLVLRAGVQRRKAEADPRIKVESLTNDTTTASDGAVLSVQAGDVWLPEEDLAAIWTAENLERLARTYWWHLSRASGYTLRVMYGKNGRAMALFGLIPLITFHLPDYEMGDDRASVRWRIRRGLLVSQRGADRDGYLGIEVSRRQSDRPGLGRLHVEVSVANFYPSIAHSVSQRLYTATQSRIHILVVYGFLRSLANGRLVTSKVGRFAQWPKEVTERREARQATKR
ncbi:MAG: hypothetical protein J7513_16985 [Solirubrobacteraceae bacterium]|nr:hypothetical protein [Solirubrobacteraceae bacterium]